MQSLQGQLLIATPKLSDPNFFHAVVLVVQHNAEGSLGLVLNRPLGVSVTTVWQQLGDSPCLIEGVVHQGGPCEGPLMVVHADDEASDMKIAQGLHFSTNKDVIERLVVAGTDSTRFFIGYAGWGAGQLELEMQSASWLTMKAEPAHVFDPPDDLWHEVHRQLVRATQTSWIPPGMMPKDPSLN